MYEICNPFVCAYAFRRTTCLLLFDGLIVELLYIMKLENNWDSFFNNFMNKPIGYANFHGNVFFS